MGKAKVKEIDLGQGPLVRQAFELYASGDYPFHRLRDEMKRRGLRGRGGNVISLNGLTTMLNNPFYMGLIHIRKTNEIFEGAHCALITKALYDKVQGVLRGNRTGSPNKHDFIFRRLIRCAECGRSLIGEIKKGRYVYYRCHTRECPGACVTEGAIVEHVRGSLSPLGFDAVEIGDLRDLLEEHTARQTNERTEREATIRILVAKCDERITRMTDALIDGLIDKETFDARKSTILKEKRGHLDRLEHIASELSLVDRIEEKVELANTAYLNYENGNHAEKRDLLLSLMSNFQASGKNPAITMKSPYQKYLNWRISTCCDQCKDEPRTRASKILDIFVAAENLSTSAPMSKSEIGVGTGYEHGRSSKARARR